MAPMDQKDLEGFLSQPWLGRLGTIRGKRPHLVPIWYLYENGTVFMSTGKQSVKARNIAKNHKVSLAIDMSVGGLRHMGVIFEGEVELVTERTAEMTARIYERYVGKENLKHPFVQKLMGFPRVVLKLTPRKTLSWDYSREEERPLGPTPELR